EAQDVDRRLGDVLERGLVRKEIEALKDHADLRPLPGDPGLALLGHPPVLFPIAHQLPVDLDPAGVDLLEVVEAADEGRLAGARRADHADGLPAAHLERDALQHLEPPKALADIASADDDAGGRGAAHLAPRAQTSTGVQTCTTRSQKDCRSSCSQAASLRSI